MSDYGGHTWINGVDATNQTRMNAIENGIVGTPGLYMVAPYQLANNVTINSGSTNTYTCTGGSTGVTSGAKAALLTGYFTEGTAGGFVSITPQGTAWNNGNYPTLAAPTAALYSFFVIASLNVSNGQIDVKANSGNCVGLFLWINGYVH
jgi:hypothetical protein